MAYTRFNMALSIGHLDKLDLQILKEPYYFTKCSKNVLLNVAITMRFDYRAKENLDPV